ncbi:hypothetical protein ACFFHF_02280, partial [Robertmurraya beringensis]
LEGMIKKELANFAPKIHCKPVSFLDRFLKSCFNQILNYGSYHKRQRDIIKLKIYFTLLLEIPTIH